MDDICWSCKAAEYHDYQDKYGIRCRSCGQKKADDPRLKPKTPTKRVARSKG
ncbi:hypothetical protein SEA_STELLA_5 [Streptomyces phage Stella]|nr:hypothetical protein SEA_STELLA_5 [Streptomyces phage Stella]